MRDDFVYLKHILEAIDKIEGYLKGFNYESFLRDEKTVDAVVRKLEIIGEAARNVSAHFQNKHQEIPWDKMVGMRNRLTHEYFGVNTKMVWDTCQTDLKELKALILPLLQK